MKPGVLLLHGFAGNRAEVAPLKDYLEARGYAVSSPVLAGHESTRRDMARSKYSDWIASARAAAEELGKHCDGTAIVGFSTGGLIAARICADAGARGIVFVNTPVRFWNARQIVKNIFTRPGTYIKYYFTMCTDKPARSLIEFLRILSNSRPLFVGIKCPALVIQSLDDDTVNPGSADHIHGKLTGEKGIVKYKSGGHQIFAGEAAEDVCRAIGEFLEGVFG